MSLIEVGGLIAALVMGMVLGLVGAGGSILTIPILVYLFGLTPSRATGVSLAVVGGVALVGAVLASRKGEFDSKAAVTFGLPSVVIAFSIRRWLMPTIPDALGPMSKDSALLVLFAAIMFIAARAMLRKSQPPENQEPNVGRWLAGGIGAGVITGVLGAGGGGVIVAALSAGMGLPMRKAVGTSLAIIAMNSTAGLLAEWMTQAVIDWSLVGKVGGVALIGMFVGAALRSRVSSANLKTGFGYLVIAVAIFILGQEIF